MHDPDQSLSLIIRNWLIKPVLSAIYNLQGTLKMTEAEQLSALRKLLETERKTHDDTVALVATLAATVAKLIEVTAKLGNSSPEVDAAVADAQSNLDAIDALIKSANPPAPAPAPAPAPTPPAPTPPAPTPPAPPAPV